MTSRFVMSGVVAASLAVAAAACAPGGGAATGGGATLAAVEGAVVPYKLGTFERDGKTFMGLVLRDAQVVDIAQASAAFEAGNSSAAKLAVPADLKGVIVAYESGWKERLGAIAKAIPAQNAPAFAYALDGVKALPPVRPSLILNAGGNYTEHTAGIAAQQARAGAAPEAVAKAVTAPGIWERTDGDTRDNPYLFLKSPTVVIGATDPIVMPQGRTNIDFECEFDTVIGKFSYNANGDRNDADYVVYVWKKTADGKINYVQL